MNQTQQQKHLKQITASASPAPAKPMTTKQRWKTAIALRRHLGKAEQLAEKLSEETNLRDVNAIWLFLSHARQHTVELDTKVIAKTSNLG